MEPHETQSSQSGPFDSDTAWDFLSQLIDEFCTQWEAAPPAPKFAPFAERLGQINDAAFRRIGLIELVKVEFEFRSRDSFQWRELAFYLDHWPELGSASEPPGELVNEARRLGPGSGSGSGKAALLMDLEPDATHTLSLHQVRQAHQLEPGNSIDDFDLLSRLGRGAFATVFLARQISMQRLVALKVSADQGHEGPTLAKLNHPNIVRVFDQRVLTEKSLRLMYMEYVAGGSLADVIKKSKEQNRRLNSELFVNVLDEKLSDAGNAPPVESQNRSWLALAEWPKVVAKIGAQIADAIAYTHSEGVLHRDIKPANVLLDEHGYPKLVDFNISYGNKVTGATAASSFGGSLSYMSPEQLEAFNPTHGRTAEEVDGACDVYALGVTLYELLTGEYPFEKVEECEPVEMINRMVDQRNQGLSKQKQSELSTEDHLLGMTIRGALAPDAQSRPGIDSMQKQLQCAADDQVSRYLAPPGRSWRGAICRFPWPFILAIVFGVALVATLYVIAYNAEESVSPEDQNLFLANRQIINRTIYPIGFVLLIGLFWKTYRLLRSEDQQLSAQQLGAAIESNLSFGHTVALLFMGLWTVCGFLFPVLMSIRGAELPSRAWIDFPLSHFLAGFICGAFVFFGLTFLSIVAWHPRLMMAAMKRGKHIETQASVGRIQTRLYWYRVIAIGAPLVAIATLVNFRTTNTVAVSYLSILTIVGLAAISIAISRINKAVKILERC